MSESNILSNQLKYWRCERPDEWIMDSFIRKAEKLEDQLKHAYCGIIGSDSIVGLDSCDNYKEWLLSLNN